MVKKRVLRTVSWLNPGLKSPEKEAAETEKRGKNLEECGILEVTLSQKQIKCWPSVRYDKDWEMCCSKHTGNGDLERSRQGKDKGQQKRAKDERGEEESMIVI